jgi:hypothetical protein
MMAARCHFQESAMGILDKVGEVVGAVAAVEALEKVDPDAGMLAKAAAAVVGFEGTGKLESALEKKYDETVQEAGNAQPADSTDSQA